MDELPFAPGDIVADKFRLERVIGRGGMGVVFAAKHLELEELVALKFLHPDLLESPERVSRFVQEARAVARLKSVHVVRVHDVGTLDNEMPYIVMEYLEGEDLRQVVRQRGPLPPPDAVAHVIAVCLAMAEAHNRGVIHRDLKPKNLFLTYGLDGEPLVKVLDFGICKLARDTNPNLEDTRADATMGSPNFISPEQMRSARNVDIRTDIWALGAVLYYLLSGRPPFQAQTLPELCLKVMNDPPDPLGEDVPAALAAIVLGCLSKTPAKRPQSVGALARSLAPFGGERGVELLGRGRRVFAESTRRSALENAPDDSALELTQPALGETLSTNAHVDETGRTRQAWRRILLPAVTTAAVAGVVLILWPDANLRISSPPDSGARNTGVTAESRVDASPPTAPVIDASAPAPVPAPFDARPAPDVQRPPRRRPRRRLVDAGPPAPPAADASISIDAATSETTPLPDVDAAAVRPRLDPRDRRD